MKNGSQQLLICLGWLIYHIKLIQNCMKQTLNSDSIFDYDDTSSLYQVCIFSSNLRLNCFIKDRAH